MKLTHPKSKRSIDVSPDHAANYVSQGWQKSPQAKAAEKKSEPKSDDDK